MKRSQLVLLGLLAVQLLAIVLSRGLFARPAGESQAGPLRPALQSVSAARVEIDGSDGKAVTLIRDGAQWKIEQAAGFPADTHKVATLLRQLTGLEVSRPVVRSGRYHTALEVSDQKHQRRVRIAGEARGKPIAGVYLGTSPNYRITHVRREGDDRVYEASGIGVFDVPEEPSGWITPRLLDVEADQVVGVRVENAKGRFEAEKGADGAWKLAGAYGAAAALDATKVNDLVRIAATLQITDPAGKLDATAQGLASPAATVTLRTASGAEAFVVGGKASDGKRYIARPGADLAAMTLEGSVEKFVSGKAADFK